MTVLYIIIGVIVGAVVIFLLMNRKVTALNMELVRKDTEMNMLAQQHNEEAKQREQQRNDELKQRGLKSRLILQIHDELLIEAAQDEVEEVKELLRDNMENAVQLAVPLYVDVHTGDSLYDAKQQMILIKNHLYNNIF